MTHGFLPDQPSFFLLRRLGAALALAGCMNVPNPSLAADPLAFLNGTRRPLLLFAKSRSDAQLDRQLEILRERRPDLAERDVLVLVSQGTQETVAAIGYAALPGGTARALYDRFQPAAHGLTVVLVGKDGEQKGRWERVVEPDEIVALIDAMPMRQQEAGTRPAAAGVPAAAGGPSGPAVAQP